MCIRDSAPADVDAGLGAQRVAAALLDHAVDLVAFAVRHAVHGACGQDGGAEKHGFVDGVPHAQVDVVGHAHGLQGGDAAVQRLGRIPQADEGAVGDADVVHMVVGGRVQGVQPGGAVDEAGQYGAPAQVCLLYTSRCV